MGDLARLRPSASGSLVKRRELEHILRAAADIADDDEDRGVLESRAPTLRVDDDRKWRILERIAHDFAAG